MHCYLELPEIGSDVHQIRGTLLIVVHFEWGVICWAALPSVIDGECHNLRIFYVLNGSGKFAITERGIDGESWSRVEIQAETQ